MMVSSSGVAGRPPDLIGRYKKTPGTAEHFSLRRSPPPIARTEPSLRRDALYIAGSVPSLRCLGRFHRCSRPTHTVPLGVYRRYRRFHMPLAPFPTVRPPFPTVVENTVSSCCRGEMSIYAWIARPSTASAASLSASDSVGWAWKALAISSLLAAYSMATVATGLRWWMASSNESLAGVSKSP